MATNSFTNSSSKLVRPELLSSVNSIASILNISKDEVKTVLTTYQKYLDDTGLISNIDFSQQSIDDYILKNFLTTESGYFSTCSSGHLKPFKKEFGFDIFKDIIRSEIKDISPSAKFLLNDLKYLGLDQKSAEVVYKFEQEGIELITSSRFEKLNNKMEEFLSMIKNNNLEKIKKIKLFGKEMGVSNTAAAYCNQEIKMNPINIVSRKGVNYTNMQGKKLNENDDLDVLIHEYFHFLHENKLGFLNFSKMGNKSLFAYLCHKNDQEVYFTIKDHLFNSNDEIFRHLDAFICDNSGDSQNRLEVIAKAINYIKNNINDIFSANDDKAKALKILDDAYQKCKYVKDNCRDYALKSPLETVAECGMYRLTGKIKDNPPIDDLLKELGCPAIKE